MDEPTTITPNQPSGQPPAELPSGNQTPPPPPPGPQTPLPIQNSPKPKKRVNKMAIGLALVVVLMAGALIYLLLFRQPAKSAVVSSTPTPAASQAAATAAPGLQLDPAKNYGNKYASGVLPVGDSKYTTDAAKKGYVYTCGQYAQNLKTAQAGASARGPWFTNNNTEYDINKKARVKGAVTWQASFNNAVSGSTRTITSNDLPSHTTGVYPIAATDPAYAYDKNPNSITSQSLTYALNNSPSYGDPKCMGGQVGIMLTGVALFNGFDAGGRDAGAWEVQDDCAGHPEKTGEYHYHTLSSCIKDTSVSTVIGFALDGFPITGPKVGDNNILTTADLDECHGLTSSITLDNKKVTTYHYVMTQDFPYSASCFRATAITPPGQPAGGQAPR